MVEKNDFKTTFLHPGIAVILPWLTLTLLCLYLRFLPVPGGAIYPLLELFLLAAAAVTVLLAVFFKTDLGGKSAIRLREFIIIILLFGLVLFLLAGTSLGNLPPWYWISLIIIALQWAFTRSIHNRLLEREAFTHFTEAVPDGVEANSFLRYKKEIVESFNGLRSLKTYALSWLWGLIFCALVLFAFLPVNDILITILSIATIISLCIFVAWVNHSLESHRFLVLGAPIPKASSRRSLGRVFWTMSALAVLSALLAIPPNVLSPELPLSFFMLLARLVMSMVGHGGSDRIVERSKQLGDSGYGATSEYEPTWTQASSAAQQSSDWILRAGAITGILVIVLFVVYPLFRYRDALYFLKRFGAFFGRFFVNFFSGLGILAGGIINIFRFKPKQKKRYDLPPLPGAVKKKQSAQEYAVQEKARHQSENAAVRDFMQVVRWGERNNISFHPSIAPTEYAAMLSTVFPSQSALFSQSAVDFEFILYAHQDADRNATAQRLHEISQRIQRLKGLPHA